MAKHERRSPQPLSLGRRLRRERERRNWSQEQLAAALGTAVSISTINRWEHDKSVPRPYYRDLLCRLFDLTHDALFGEGADEEGASETFLPLWSVPHLRNLYFTGREEVLTRLHRVLRAEKIMILAALSGLGGVGKTQIAVEYAYRYADEYNAVVWIHAEARQTLISDYVHLADLLHLPERKDTDQQRVAAAVMRWLQHTPGRWLLILDNVEDLELVTGFLPRRGAAHVLLTTRIQATGPSIQSIELDTLDQEEGTLLLLRRAKRLSADALLDQATVQERAEAEKLCALLGGLPLALDQAAAYIEENQCRLADYLHLYQLRRAQLLRRRGGQVGANTSAHVVATTWKLSFEDVERTNPAAADLLRMCAFLHPDGIPEALLLAGAEELNPQLQMTVADPLQWDEAIGVLRRYSMVRRAAEEQMLLLHRLVQVVIKDAMAPQVYSEWARRAVHLVSQALPEMEFNTWPLYQLYLPHALVCIDLMEQEDMRFPQAARLLHQVGSYLYERGRYSDAELILKRALSTREQLYGSEHPDTATSLHDLGMVHWKQGKYEQAESVYRRALSIREHVQGAEHPDTANTLTFLGVLYWHQGKYEQVEPLFRRALSIRERALGPTHSLTALSLNNLAALYYKQGKYEQAGPLFQRAPEILEQALGPTHPDTALTLNNLAEFYRNQGQYAQAEPLYQRALAIREQALGPMHPDMAVSLHTLARLHRDQGYYDQAGPLMQRGLTIREQALGPEHPETADSMHDLAELYYNQGQYEQAEPLFGRALAIRERMLEANHPDTAQSLSGLAMLYRDQGRYEQAEPLFQRAVEIMEQVGLDNPSVATALENYASLLRQMQQQEKATALETRARMIRLASTQTASEEHKED